MDGHRDEVDVGQVHEGYVDDVARTDVDGVLHHHLSLAGGERKDTFHTVASGQEAE